MAFTTSSTFESLEIAFDTQENRITAITAIFDGDSPSPSYVQVYFRQGYKLDRFAYYGAGIFNNFTRDICERERFSE